MSNDRASCFVGALLFLLFFCAAPAFSQVFPETATRPSPKDEQIQTLTNWVLKEAPSIGCEPGACKVLVSDFLVPEGVTSLLGVQLADDLSKQLKDSQAQIQVFDRNLLRTYRSINRVDTDSLKTDQEVATFAHDLGASAVVTAKVERTEGDSFRLFVRFLNANDKSLVVRTDLIVTGIPQAETAPPAAHGKALQSGSSFPTTQPNIVSPWCYYMPNPHYSKRAKKAKFQGAVRVDAIILPDESVTNPRILESPGLDLDESILTTMKTWKCHPATTDGKPVPTRVQFEINFRLY
jgi:TonB family protein